MQRKAATKASLALTITSLLLMGCDDTDSSTINDDIATLPNDEVEARNSAQIDFVFPTPNANLAGAREFTFYGSIVDETGSDIDDATIEKVELSDEFNVSQGSYSSGEFSVSTPVGVGEQDYRLVVTFTDGSISEQSITLQNSALLHFPIALEIDETNNRAFVFEDNVKEIHVYDLESGYGYVLSGNGVGSGDRVEEAGDMYYHSSTDILYLVDEDEDSVVKIDVGTGERTKITDNIISAMNPFGQAEGIAYLDSDTLLVAEQAKEHGIYSVDINTGTRQQISTDNIGDGELFQNARKLFISSDKTTAVVADDGADRLVRVDLTSGDRTVISGYESGDVLIGAGEELQSAEGLAHDSTRNTALVADDKQDKLFSIDLASGDRSVILDKANEGALISDITDVDYHVANQSAYITDKSLDNIIKLDMNTSQVTPLLKANSKELTSVEHSDIEAEKLLYDEVNRRVIALADNIIYSISEQGDRLELSGPNVGLGDELNFVYDMAIDAQSQKLWVGSQDKVIEIDLATGDRRLVSSNTIDSDLLIDRISTLHFNGSTLVVGDEGESTRDNVGDKIVFVDIKTGKKTLITDSNSAGDAVLYNVKQVFQEGDTLYGITEFRPLDDRLFQVDIASGEKNYLSVDISPYVLDTVEDVIYDKYDDRLLVINAEHILSIDLKTQQIEFLTGVVDEGGYVEVRGQGASLYYAEAITADEDYIYCFLREDSALVKISKRTGDRIIVSI